MTSNCLCASQYGLEAVGTPPDLASMLRRVGADAIGRVRMRRLRMPTIRLQPGLNQIDLRFRRQTWAWRRSPPLEWPCAMWVRPPRQGRERHGMGARC